MDPEQLLKRVLSSYRCPLEQLLIVDEKLVMDPEQLVMGS
jgi:hypothetical protein